jgi:hypothetical protein
MINSLYYHYDTDCLVSNDKNSVTLWKNYLKNNLNNLDKDNKEKLDIQDNLILERSRLDKRMIKRLINEIKEDVLIEVISLLIQ